MEQTNNFNPGPTILTSIVSRECTSILFLICDKETSFFNSTKVLQETVGAASCLCNTFKMMLRSIFHEVFVALFFGIVFSVHLSYNETLDESVNGTASNIVLHPNIKAYNCQDDNIKVRYIDRTTIKNCSEPINEVKWFEVCAKFWFSELIGIILCYVYYFSILPKFRKRKRKFGNITYLIFNYFSDKGSSTASRKY